MPKPAPGRYYVRRWAGHPFSAVRSDSVIACGRMLPPSTSDGVVRRGRVAGTSAGPHMRREVMDRSRVSNFNPRSISSVDKNVIESYSCLHREYEKDTNLRGYFSLRASASKSARIR